MSARKPKFRVGQVVCVVVAYRDRAQYGRVLGMVDEIYRVQFWDSDNADTWEWKYREQELSALTKRESGAGKKGRGR